MLLPGLPSSNWVAVPADPAAYGETGREITPQSWGGAVGVPVSRALVSTSIRPDSSQQTLWGTPLW
jgi:hypothetical protein